MIAPDAVFAKLVQAKQAADLHTPGFNQRIVHEIVRSGFLDAHVATIRSRYRVQRDAMQAALVAHLPTSGPLACRWQMPGGGMFFWVELPEGVDSEALLVKAVARGVAFVPGAPFSPARRANTLRLSFVTVGAGSSSAASPRSPPLRDLREDAVAAGGQVGEAARGARAMSRFAFTQVDVFTATALGGNPLAVVHGADALDDERMQAFARWTNLSETTFLLTPTDPGADYRVRIFTPGGELPFAGHPTLGSCHAWRERGGRPKVAGEVVQQCGVGLVRIKLDAAGAAFAAPPLARAEVGAEELDAVLAALGTDRGRLVAAQFLKNGPNWLSLELDSAATVLALEPDAAQMKLRVGRRRRRASGGQRVRLRGARLHRPPVALRDPVTGSLNAGLGEWLIGSGRAPARLAAQGTRLGRAGRVRIAREGATIWVAATPSPASAATSSCGGSIRLRRVAP